MVGEKSIDHMALGFGMFDFAEQGREGKGRGEHTRLAESLVKRRETWAKGGAARPVRRLLSPLVGREMRVSVSVCGRARGEGVEGREIKRRPGVSKALFGSVGSTGSIGSMLQVQLREFVWFVLEVSTKQKNLLHAHTCTSTVIDVSKK